MPSGLRGRWRAAGGWLFAEAQLTARPAQKAQQELICFLFGQDECSFLLGLGVVAIFSISDAPECRFSVICCLCKELLL